ncbi:MAG: hypothetical protein JJ921_15275 [Pseudomonadales bacterium]|nr:hypothetical protein [Pseudomonadales bacterium]MBO6703701.1 hypothetical protein [Pseudomonadales bacterium]MBO6823755.1 hypothetical protein [Pseudomonadales bacterium]MBO7004242.1 hypothetical protein [Pseudomonadales bacterium]
MIDSGRSEQRSLLPVLTLAFILAACSIIYELLAAQTLSMLAANTVIWYSLVVGLFLGAMGVGAFFSEKTGKASSWLVLLRIELALTILGSLTVPLIKSAHTLYSILQLGNDAMTGVIVFYSVVFPVVFILGVLTGIELPLIMRLARQIRDETRAANMALGWDYLGSLVGAMLFPLVILTSVDLITAGFIIAAVNLLVAIWIWLFRLDGSRFLFDRFGLLAIAGCLVIAMLNASAINQYFLQRYYYYHLMDEGLVGLFSPRFDLPEIRRTRSAYQVIDMVEGTSPSFFADFIAVYSDKLTLNPDFPVDQKLFLNGAPQTDTRLEEVYHEWFAHFPIILNGQVPKRVLVLGGGDGFLVRELLKYPGISSIQHIDIDPVLIELARTDDVLKRANGGALDDARVDTVITDGYQFLRHAQKKYDAIYIDLPVPNNYDLAKLYSREFYEFVRRRIADDGFAVFDSSQTSALSVRAEDGSRELLPRNTWPVFGHTLKRAGFGTIVPFYSTLETDHPGLQEVIDEKGFNLSPAEREKLQEIRSPARRELERRRLLAEHHARLKLLSSDYLLQGFVFLAPEVRSLDKRYKDMSGERDGLALHVLDAKRFELSFTDYLVVPEEVDKEKVNSIVRPTLPVTPWWRPMTGY